MSEIELYQPVDLCDAQGNLNPAAIGWSRHPIHTCNLSRHPMRKKRWNYWCVTTPEFLFSVTLSNIDYMGLAFVYFLDFESKQFIEQTVMAPFGKGCSLPDLVNSNLAFNHRLLHLSFTGTSSGVDIEVTSPNFGGKELHTSLSVIRPPEHETLNVVIPWSHDRFQFTSKQNCLPVSGIVIMDGRIYSIPANEGFACLDFGRGIWRYESFWNWACFSSPGLGANLGAGWTDGTGYTENGLTINGSLHKIGQDIAFTYDPNDFLKPWQLQTRDSDQVNLIFTPFYKRVARTNFAVLTSEVHQMIGRFSGTVTGNNGERMEVKDVIGWAEDHQARW
jgi:hypothetical protein